MYISVNFVIFKFTHYPDIILSASVGKGHNSILPFQE